MNPDLASASDLPQYPKSSKTINILLQEQEFQILKIYVTCRSTTMREFATGVMREWMDKNRGHIEETIGKVSSQIN